MEKQAKILLTVKVVYRFRFKEEDKVKLRTLCTKSRIFCRLRQTVKSRSPIIKHIFSNRCESLWKDGLRLAL